MAEYDKRKLKPIGQKTIVDQIINTIIDSIIKGNYKAGTKLPSEYELIEEMQVSRNSLREAMKYCLPWELWKLSGEMEPMCALRSILPYLTEWSTV